MRNSGRVMTVISFKRRRKRDAWRSSRRTRDAALVAIGLAGFAFAGVTTWEHGFVSGRAAYAAEAPHALSRGGDLSSRFRARYRDCDAARTAGAAPIYRGEPGYRSPLDADDDGIACEPITAR
jgi:hypothetical protein